MNSLSYKRIVKKIDKNNIRQQIKESLFEKVLTKGSYEQKLELLNKINVKIAVDCLFDFENKKYYTEENAILLHNRIIKSENQRAIEQYLNYMNSDKQFIYNESEAIKKFIEICNIDEIFDYFYHNQDLFSQYQELIEKQMIKRNDYSYCGWFCDLTNANTKTLKKLVLLSNDEKALATFIDHNKSKNLEVFVEKAKELKSDKMAMAIMIKDKKYHTPELINLVKNSDNQYIMEMALDVLDDNEIDKHKLAMNLGNHISRNYSVQDTLYIHPIGKFLSKYGKYLTKEERTDFDEEDMRKQIALIESTDATDEM